VSGEESQQGFACSIDLSAEIAQLSMTRPWAKGFASTVLLKTSDLRLVLFAMQAGSQISKHHSPGRIVIHCLHGAIRLQLAAEARELREGGVFALDRKLEHDVHAQEDSVFLLTIVQPE